MSTHRTVPVAWMVPAILLMSGSAIAQKLSVEGTTDRAVERAEPAEQSEADAASAQPAKAGGPPAQGALPAGGAAGGESQTQAAPPAGEQPTAAASQDAAAAATQRDNASVDMELRDIEERVNELKEKIFQSKARLMQLQEVVLHGAVSGAKAVLIHRNEMGSSFRLIRAQYALDGATIFNRVDTGGGELDDQDEIEFFNGSIGPGNHQISVYLEYQGNGFGIFSYLKGYKFKIKSSYTFSADEGKLTTIRVVGFEKGGITTDLKDRPSVRYDIEVTRVPRPDVAGGGEGGQEKPAAAKEGG